MRFLSNLFGRRVEPAAASRKILCLVVHYFGRQSEFIGCSTHGDKRKRRSIVEQTVVQLRSLPNTEVKVCGIGGQSLLPIDWDFGGLADPRLLVYEALARLVEQLDDYDYFLVVEDDILVPPQVPESIIRFDQENPLNHCLHPNRLECAGNTCECVDLAAMPGWTAREKTYRGHRLRVAVNPHSAFLMLSREKLGYALKSIDPGYRERFLGGYMASAFAYYHRPFELYRPYNDLEYHCITHLDHWMNPLQVHDVVERDR